MTIPAWDRLTDAVKSTETGPPLYERVANAIADGISSGEFPQGYRLPPVRDLARDLGVSGSTVVSVYSMLREQGLVRGEVGRGTFVHFDPAATRSPAEPARPPAPVRDLGRLAWRRPMLAAAEARLRDRYPAAVDLMRGSPDPAFLPVAALRRAWARVGKRLTAADLQYPRQNDIEADLAAQVLPRLAEDGIHADADQLLVANSTQQFLSLAAERLVLDAGTHGPITVAIEEPGYQTAMDTFERVGLRLVGMSCDAFGVRPSALRAALAAGARMVVCTPRAQSPLGVSWTSERVGELATVLREYPDVLVFEDDHFAEASASRPGSLFAAGPATRMLYVRSFSKSLAPDMRVSVAVTSGSLRHELSHAKSYADGWTARAAQRVMAALLADGETISVLDRARTSYARRRDAAVDAFLSTTREPATVDHGPDGLHVWLPVSPTCDTNAVVEAVARDGYLVAASDPFYLSPGGSGHLRLNAGAASADDAAGAARAIARAIADLTGTAAVALTP
jgi:DNA-binding transcriptional MocR family regulator